MLTVLFMQLEHTHAFSLAMKIRDTNYLLWLFQVCFFKSKQPIDIFNCYFFSEKKPLLSSDKLHILQQLKKGQSQISASCLP